MQVVNYHRANVRPVSAAYSLDDDVQLRTTREFIADGYELNFTNALSSVQDTSSNNDSLRLISIIIIIAGNFRECLVLRTGTSPVMEASNCFVVDSTSSVMVQCIN